LACLGGAQQMAMPVIGFLISTTPRSKPLAAFRQALADTGYVEGRNVAIEFRSAEADYDRLPALATELVQRQVTVIVAFTIHAARAAKAATKVIPIVALTAGDPVADDFVASFSRPGGNLTGFTIFAYQLGAKRLEMLHELVPKAAVIALLVNPNDPTVEGQLKVVRESAGAIGLQIQVLSAGTDREIEAAFTALGERRAGGLVVAADLYFNTRREQLVALAARHAIPAIYYDRLYIDAGGLISYGNRFDDLYYQAGVYTARILKGEKPADLPVQQPTKIELVINLKTAKALGLTVPQSLLARADEVIE
jgi:putative ABC transport system substrate-binding protein